MGVHINTAAGLASDRCHWREALRHATDQSLKDDDYNFIVIIIIICRFSAENDYCIFESLTYRRGPLTRM